MPRPSEWYIFIMAFLPSLDEDEACDIEGDISFIKTIEAMRVDALNSARAAAYAQAAQ
jgi:hypothetical protein